MVMSLVMLDKPISLKEYSAGLFISSDGVLCVKTEYANDSYIVSSGERFWGGTDNDNDLGNLQNILVIVKKVHLIYYLK